MSEPTPPGSASATGLTRRPNRITRKELADGREIIYVDEPGAPATIDQLTRLLPLLVPDRLDDIVDAGLVDRTGPDRR